MKRLVLVLVLLIACPIITWTAINQTELTYNPKNAKGNYAFVPYLNGTAKINLVNGNMIFGRQLVSRPGRAGFGVDLSLVYNSKLWARNGNVMTLSTPGSRVGMGWGLDLPKLVQGTSSYALVLPDGSSHEIANYGGGNWESVDSTYILFNPTTNVATLKGGVKLTFGNTVGNTTYLTLMEDRNGNQIKATYVPGTGNLSQVQDAQDVVANFSYNGDGTLQSIQSMGQINTTIDFTYTPAALSPQFSINTQIPSGEVQLTAIDIWTATEDLKQAFTYNGFGEITQIQDVVNEYGWTACNPNCTWGIVQSSTSNLTSYGYSTLTFYDSTYGSVEQRAVTSITDLVNNNYNWSLSYQVDSTKSSPASVTITEPGNIQTVYTLAYTTGGCNWSDGFVQRVDKKSSGTVVRSYGTSWTQDNTSLTYIDNPRVTSQSTTLDNQMTTYVNAIYTTDGTGNVREVDEYGSNNSLMRKTITDYWHESNPSYTALNLTNLVSYVSVQDGNGVEAARTTYGYDAYSLTNYGNTQVAASTTVSGGIGQYYVYTVYPNTQTPGDFNIVVVGWSGTASIMSVTDWAGNTYNLAIGPTSGNGIQQAIYYASNIVGPTPTGQNNLVSVRFTSSPSSPDVRILEYSGVSALDVTSGASGTGSAPNSGMATTTAANDLVFGAATASTATASVGSGFTWRITSANGNVAEDILASPIGSYA
jgi:hypothetical protein